MLRPDLEAIRARAEAATRGPWHYVHGYGFDWHTSGDGPPTPNTAFACAARADIPALLDYVAELERQLGHHKGELARLATAEVCNHPGCVAPRFRGGNQCLSHGCRRCGHVILADTEDWPEPLCYGCYDSKREIDHLRRVIKNGAASSMTKEKCASKLQKIFCLSENEADFLLKKFIKVFGTALKNSSKEKK